MCDLSSSPFVKETGTLPLQCTACLLSTQLPTCGDAVDQQQQAGWLQLNTGTSCTLLQCPPCAISNAAQRVLHHSVMQEREASNIKYKPVKWHKKMTMFSPLNKVACWGTGNKKVFQMFKGKKLKLIKWLLQMAESCRRKGSWQREGRC